MSMKETHEKVTVGKILLAWNEQGHIYLYM